jgi:general stress protein 26
VRRPLRASHAFVPFSGLDEPVMAAEISRDESKLLGRYTRRYTAMPELSFEFIEGEVRKKTFGVLTTIDRQGRPHSTGVLYGVSPPKSKFSIYVMAGSLYAKVRNVRNNANVSLVITFPHYYLRFVPASYVMFRGKATIVPPNEADGRWAFRQKRILRMNESVEIAGESVFIRLDPEATVYCYGVGIGINQLRKHLEAGSYKVMIPEERLSIAKNPLRPSDSL